MARSTVSLGMLAARALSSCSRSGMLSAALGPPLRTAAMIALEIWENALPRFLSCAALRCLMFAHFE